MNREEFDKLYLNKVVHCDTEEKANEFLALADWETSEEKTCYRITKDGMFFAYTSHYDQYGYQIVEYQLQPKFKVGDKVRVKDTIYTTINGKVGVIVNLQSMRIGFHIVKVDDTLWFLNEGKLEKVEEPTNEKETIDDIIEEIEYHQKVINELHNRLKRKEKGENKNENE